MRLPILYYSNERSYDLYKKQRKKDLENQLKQLDKNESARLGDLFNEREAETLAKIYTATMEKALKIKQTPVFSLEQNIKRLIKEKGENKIPALTYEDVPLLTQPTIETMPPNLPLLEERKTKSAPTTPNKKPFVDLSELQQRISLDPETVRFVNTLKVQELKDKLTDAGINFPTNIKKQELRNLIFRELPKKKINLTGKGIRKRKAIKK